MYRVTLSLFVLTLLVGCDTRIEQFKPNKVYALSLAHSRAVGTENASSDVREVVETLFGTPLKPRWPQELLPESLRNLVDSDRITRAAGIVSSDQDGTHRGLYFEHCVTCHGVDGGGAGPAALLQNPYPRDFRAGVFKWKSTLRGSKPTREDLLQLLSDGVPGSGMPSFALIDGQDREGLVDYVIYLSVRGEVERRLLAACVDELDYEDASPPADADRLSWPPSEKYPDDTTVTDALALVAGSWHDAKAIVVPPGPPATEAAIEEGREIFHSQIANCVGCHGTDGNGQAKTLDFDDWTKEFSTRIGLTPTDREAMKPFRKAGALRPRTSDPRNLQLGVFRGGSDAETLYRRISQGIAGTPMPGVEISEQGSEKGLSSDQVWNLIHYLQSFASDETMDANPES